MKKTTVKKLIADMWEEINPRRLELIQLKVARKATSNELDELARLQRLADRMLRIVAPLPSEVPLLRKARQAKETTQT